LLIVNVPRIVSLFGARVAGTEGTAVIVTVAEGLGVVVTMSGAGGMVVNRSMTTSAG
jgi:hypothetical protein